MDAGETRAMIDDLLKTLKPGDPGPSGFTALAAYNDYMAEKAILQLRARGSVCRRMSAWSASTRRFLRPVTTARP